MNYEKEIAKSKRELNEKVVTILVSNALFVKHAELMADDDPVRNELMNHITESSLVISGALKCTGEQALNLIFAYRHYNVKFLPGCENIH